MRIGSRNDASICRSAPTACRLLQVPERPRTGRLHCFLRFWAGRPSLLHVPLRVNGQNARPAGLPACGAHFVLGPRSQGVRARAKGARRLICQRVSGQGSGSAGRRSLARVDGPPRFCRKDIQAGGPSRWCSFASPSPTVNPLALQVLSRNVWASRFRGVQIAASAPARPCGRNRHTARYCAKRRQGWLALRCTAPKGWAWACRQS